jgi:predicted membrane protein
MANNSKYSPRVFLGLILMFFGTVFFLENIGFLHDNLSDLLFSFPGALCFIGLIIFLNARNRILGGSMLLIGGLMLAMRASGVHMTGNVFVPVILILIGINIIFKRRYSDFHHHEWNHTNIFNKTEQNVDDDRLDDVAIFGGGGKNLHSQNFQGGSITAIFGGSEIDLTGCKLAPGEQVIDIVAIFGGVEITVPSNWKIQIDVVPIFGGFSNKWRRDPNLVLDQTSTLRIKGTVIFGGGEIKFR